MHTIPQKIAVQLIAMVAMHPECAAVIDLLNPEIQTRQILTALIRHISHGNQPSALRMRITAILFLIAEPFYQLHQLIIAAMHIPNDIKFIFSKFQNTEISFSALLHLQLPFRSFLFSRFSYDI